MPAVIVLSIYLLCGVLITERFIREKSGWVKLWLGMLFGHILFMWLPALYAFAFRFSMVSQYLSLVTILGLTCISLFFKNKQMPHFSFEQQNRMLLFFIVIPLSLLCAYLFYTHILLPKNGNFYVGQSTYGDLPLHLGIASSLRNSPFPPEYSIFPGERLSYPFLIDGLSTSLMLWGLNIRWAMLLPSFSLAFLCIFGYALLCLRILKSEKKSALAVLLLFVNGGLGFLYVFDMMGVSLGTAGSHQLQAGTLSERLQNILQGWYQTPVNHSEFHTYNLRWSNIIVDMLVPQRTFLAGFSLVFPCVYLLYDGMETRSKSNFVLLGLFAGSLPLIHTHSFLALFLLSLGWCIYDIIQHRDISPWLMYVLITAVLSLPQLFGFTFRQAGNSQNFIKFSFNWVNGVGGMKDGYFWFYLKNIGLPFLALLLAMFESSKLYRKLLIGAFCIFLPAEFIRFQPNEYDNNKLLYIWYAISAIVISDYLFLVYEKLRSLRARKFIALLAAFVMFASASLSIAREVVSNEQMFGKADILLSEWIEKNTAEDDMFLTDTQHINPVSALAGRKIYVGPDLWLYYHGFSTAERKSFVHDFYQNPARMQELAAEKGLRYFIVGPYERMQQNIDDEARFDSFPLVYENEQYSVYRIGE